MTSRGYLLLLMLPIACGGDDGVRLDPKTSCTEDTGCPAGHSCLVTQCVVDGSLPFGDTCMHEQQCAAGLTCYNFICMNGCSRVYELDDCTGATWCKPLPDAATLVGDCAPSECDPATTTFCPDGTACVTFGAHIGGCLPYCEYGFVSATYKDLCEDTFTVDNSCQPLGLNQVPICLPSGDEEGPAVGAPGCDGVRNPCATDAICIDVVCRKLCSSGQANPCNIGESCLSVAGRTDLAYCRAD